MAGNDSSQVRVAGTGQIWKAALGTVLPTDSTTPWDAAFVNLGYLTDGFTLAQALKTLDIPAWQTTEPVRTLNLSLVRNIAFEMLQSNKNTAGFAYGGATVVPNPGVSLGTVAIAITTGVLTVSASETLAIGDKVQLGTLTGAAPLVAGVTYYVVSTPTSTTLTVSATLGGAAIVTTASGTSTSITKVTGGYAITIPEANAIADFVLGIDFSDGATSGRLVVPCGHQDTLPTIKSVRSDATRYAMSVQVIKPADGGQSIRPYGVDPAMTA